MTEEYALAMWDNFNSIFCLSANELEFVLNILKFKRNIVTTKVSSELCGWNISRIEMEAK